IFSLPLLWGRVGVGGERRLTSHPHPSLPPSRGKEFDFSTARSHSETCTNTNACLVAVKRPDSTMSLTRRHRIFLTLVPLLLLLAVVGSAGVTLLLQLGNSINEILRENYASVIAMERLAEAVERIDSSFQIAMSGRDDKDLVQRARRQYEDNWK